MQIKKSNPFRIKNFFVSIYKDLTYLKWYHILILFIFGSLMIIFSVLDFNSFIHPEWELEILTWNNDKILGKEYWRRVLMTLSGAASFTGAMTVVLTTFGKLSSFFWGIINCVLYGLFAFAYGYGGDAQLNILFFLPMQFWGIYNWKDNIDEEDKDTVMSRSLKKSGLFFSLISTLILFAGFYFEIPKFVEAIGSEYLFYDNNSARIIDCLTNAFSIVAQILSLYRYWEQWVLWISVDILQITMYAGVAGFGINFNILFMWGLFLINAIFGLYFWIKKDRLNRSKMIYMQKINSEINILNKNENKLYHRGLIIDSFYPFTKAHAEMINLGIEQCSQIYIIVYDEKNKKEIPNALIRKKWIEEIYKNYQELKDVITGDLSSFNLERVKGFMHQTIFKLLPSSIESKEYKEMFNTLYSSERQGRIFLNAYLGITKNPIQYSFSKFEDFKIELQNGKFQSSKKNFLDDLIPISMIYYIPRIVLLGPESCGKTTLVKKLAEHYKTSWVKEYGHEYCEIKLAEQQKKEIKEKENEKEQEQDQDQERDISYEWNDEDFIKISTKQSEMENECAVKANQFLICDTDSFATNIWYERYMKKKLDALEDIHRKHTQNVSLIYYFLFSPKYVPFIQDGTRDGEKIREWMFNLFKERLTEENKIFFIIEGNYEEMEHEMKKKIEELLF